MKKLFPFLFLGIFTSSIGISQRINLDMVGNHISYLSADQLNGRGTGSNDEYKVAEYIANQFKQMHLQPRGSKWFYYDFNFKHSGKAHDTSTTGLKLRKGRNVIAFLDNEAEFTIVIGAHHDHIGLGHDGNSLDANPANHIHNGADDNASGVAGVLELARYFSLNGIKEKTNFLFMTFSGEELGLIGSKKWCERPTFPLNKINYMINMDMIGRMNDSTKKLMVLGTGTSDVWIPTLDKINPGFSIKYDSSGIGPSDQTSFYLKDIPVLQFFTGQHSDYHKPTDDANKINLKGETQILELIIDLIFSLEQNGRINFYKTVAPKSEKMSFKVTLGVMPDYTFDGKGMRLDGVSENKPASKAGLLGGDIIIGIGTDTVEDVKGYMKILSSYNKGEKAKVIYVRNGQEQETEVIF